MSSRRLRPRGQRPVVAVLVVLLVVVSGLAVVQKWQGAAWWVVGGAAGLAGLLGGVGPLWQRWREQRAAGTGAVRRSVSTAGKTVADMSLANLGQFKLQRIGQQPHRRHPRDDVLARLEPEDGADIYTRALRQSIV